MLAKVAVERNITEDGVLSYRVPHHMKEIIRVGCLVTVPLGKGNTPIKGFVVHLQQDDVAGEWKDILEIVSDNTMLDEELVGLALWVSEYYVCSCYYVLEYMLPKLAKAKSAVFLEWDENADQTQFMLFDGELATLGEEIRTNGAIQLEKWIKTHPGKIHLLEDLEQRGFIRRTEKIFYQEAEKTEAVYESCVMREQLSEVEANLKRAKVQWEILRYLTLEGPTTGATLKQYWSSYATPVKELLRKELIKKSVREIPRFHTDNQVFRNDETIHMNREQQHALGTITEALDGSGFKKILLHGVTGSGKTEVYLQALTQARMQGKGVMVLVPEIALTPQLIGRFRAVLGEYVEVFHSNMSDGERFDTWKRLYAGESHIVIGVRSAVFAPVRNLGLIIVDEEHETTYKQSEPDPRYHALKVAQYRMEHNNGVLLLGSATPSVESYFNAERGESILLTMEQRATTQQLPNVEIADMRQEFQQGNRSIFSRTLKEQIENCLKNGEQVILFLNRRGFSSAVVCRECGYTLECEKCAIALTYHQKQKLAKCHYCDYMIPAPDKCPSCGSRFIRYMGTGTEQVEEEVRKLWPWVVTNRMDLDTTRNKNAHGAILERFAKGETQILIGTQMVTKGLNFPNVTLVGVMMADMTLNQPDYTAAERTFQLLTQVAGRAGRGEKPGHVVIQTYTPEHYSLLTAKNHDYHSFYSKEINNRKLMGYAPFATMVRLLVSDFTDREIPGLLMDIAKRIHQTYPTIELLGPSEAPISMIRKRYRFHLILKGEDLNLLREAAAWAEKQLNLSRKSKTLRIIIDVEPQSVL